MDKSVYTTVAMTAEIVSEPGNISQISQNDSQLLYGELFEVFKQEGEWLKGKSLVDGYEGYVYKQSLETQVKDITHFVDVRLTQSYAEPNFKTRPIGDLSFMSRTSSFDERQNGFLETSCGWVHEDHLTPIDKMKNKNILDTAMLFLGTPYLYGGRSCLGIDCSGLVQLALLRNGIGCPRDSGDQSQIGENIEHGKQNSGDLIFFPGHVGIFTDEKNILNATARTMDTRIEPLDKLIEDYKEITGIRRI